MKEFHHANEYHKLPADPLAPPAELSRLPAEMSQLPAEYQIPEEFPTRTSKPTKTKKSHARRLIAMCLTGFVAIQLMFNYFVPATDENRPQPSQPGVQTPTNPGSGSGGNGNSSIDIGDFSVHAAADSVQDSLIIDGIKEAYWDLDQFDYIRASIALQDAVYQYRLDYDPYALDCVAYVVDGGVVYDFGEQELDVTFRNYGSFVYFKTDRFVYEDKDGEIQSHDLLYTYLITFVDMGSTTAFRVLMIEDILSEYMLYGLSNDWEFNGYYIYGEFDGQGRCSNCERTKFFVTNYSDKPNFDIVYKVKGIERYRGRVENGAFMNGTMLILDLLYSEENNDFDTDIQKPADIINFDALDRDGKLDLDHHTVINAGSDYSEGPWLQFQDDPNIKYLANDTYVTVKYDQYDDPWDTYTIELPDPTKPLLPLDMKPAFALHQLVLKDLGELGDSGNKDDGGGDIIGDNPGVPGAIATDLTLLLSEGIVKASGYFMDDDYVRTGAYFADCLANYGLEFMEAFGESEDAFAFLYDNSYYCDGDQVYVAEKNGLSGCYFHFERGTDWFYGNAGDMVTFQLMRVTITRIEQTPQGDLYRVVRFSVGAGKNPFAYFSGDLVNGDRGDICYLEGVFDLNGNCDKCDAVWFRNAYVYEDKVAQIDGKFSLVGERYVRGKVAGGGFATGTVWYEQPVYNANTGGFEPISSDKTGIITFDFLTEDGRIDLDHSAVVESITGDSTPAYEAYYASDAVRCWADRTLLQVKYDIQSETYRSLQWDVLDYSEPIFPIDMSDSVMFR